MKIYPTKKLLILMLNHKSLVPIFIHSQFLKNGFLIRCKNPPPIGIVRDTTNNIKIGVDHLLGKMVMIYFKSNTNQNFNPLPDKTRPKHPETFHDHLLQFLLWTNSLIKGKKFFKLLASGKTMSNDQFVGFCDYFDVAIMKSLLG